MTAQYNFLSKLCKKSSTQQVEEWVRSRWGLYRVPEVKDYTLSLFYCTQMIITKSWDSQGRCHIFSQWKNNWISLKWLQNIQHIQGASATSSQLAYLSTLFRRRIWKLVFTPNLSWLWEMNKYWQNTSMKTMCFLNCIKLLGILK